VDALREHHVDFGILRANTVSHPLKQRKAGTFGYRIYGPLDAKESELWKMPMALNRTGEFRRSIENLMASAHVAVTVAYECQSHSQCALFVKEGVATAILPEIAAITMKGYPSIQPPWLKKYTREMAVAWRIKSERSSKCRLAKLVEDALTMRVAK
jgi:DNA-binding transcriptional LysR family regulator